MAEWKSFGHPACAGCCEPTPCPPGTGSKISGAHRLCRHGAAQPGQDAQGHPPWTVHVTGPNGYSATPSFTWTTVSTNVGPKWQANWTITDLEAGTYTIAAFGDPAVTMVRTIVVTERCGQAYSFIDEPKSRQVQVSVSDLGDAAPPGPQPKIGATVTVTGWRYATAIVQEYSTGAVAFLQFDDIAPPIVGSQNDRITVSYPGYCDHTQCRLIVCGHSMFIAQGACPPGGFYEFDYDQSNPSIRCPDDTYTLVADGGDDDFDLLHGGPTEYLA